MRRIQSFLLAIGLTAGGYGHAIDYDEPELMMRSGAGSAYQIPVGSSWSSKTPSVNNQGEVAMSINSVPPDFRAGVWSGTLAGGGIVDIAAGDSDLYTDVDINASGQIAWTRNESSLDGILMYDPAEDETVYLTNAPVGGSGWTAVSINDSEVLGYRAAFGFSGRGWISWDSDGGDTLHLAETGVDSSSPYAFLFTPSLNNQRQIAGKAAINTVSTNQILIVDEDGTIDILVEDSELDPDSPFDDFNNSVGFNDVGQVAFVGQLVGGGRGLYLADGNGWTQYALEGEDGLDSIEAFSPVLNNDGLVAFRGFNDAGDRAIWVADGETVTAIATQGDIVSTDLGPARLQSPDSVGGPNFGGSPTINDAGQVAFVSLLTDPENSATSLGRGLFLASPDVVDKPAMGLEKSASPETYSAVGDIIEYSYEVENTGNVTLTGPISVDDDQEEVDCPTGDLEPGESLTCTAERTISQNDLDAGSVTNQATASNDQVSSGEAVVTITADQQPGLGLEKSAEPMIFSTPGELIVYSYVVTNTGNITLSGPVTVDDDQEAVTCPSGDLAPGQSLTCQAERSISTDDVAAGVVTNIATAMADGVESGEASVSIRTPPIFDDRFEATQD